MADHQHKNFDGLVLLRSASQFLRYWWLVARTNSGAFASDCGTTTKSQGQVPACTLQLGKLAACTQFAGAGSNSTGRNSVHDIMVPAWYFVQRTDVPVPSTSTQLC
ncbi:hypothetical protein VFPPC_15378 [Pochonia chlamydosporia 170]|uniref:Uncharacterized protein n=1 Tax=Pochonia chlamydosporia 170 TaxID=1380566 RepID=A0A179G8Z9_METCM|nr:hypothetical protein VFPPC_15378 [Pochonia chlamydosporia 170]OAQ73891.1 hypothetical protein VFPPC_15378 [Pochonia chlamydosporia 170]